MNPGNPMAPVTAQFVGRSAAIADIERRILSVARRSCTVLIQGESGTGKELVARQIHARSRRAERAFVPVDCSTLSESLFESQLFGHVRGAFTGAATSTYGFFRAAEHGTLFLDEIGDLAAGAQAKLLRALQERCVVPLGGVDPVSVDVRVLAATHRNLKEMVDRGEFRHDLYFRLNVIRLHVPPLRQRGDDVLPLAEHFLAELADLHEEPRKRLAEEAVAAIRAYDWPGNVRELQSAMEYACTFCARPRIGLADLPSDVQAASADPERRGARSFPSLSEAERNHIAQALRATGGNQSRASRLLRIERHRLRRLIDRHDLQHLLK